MFTSRHKLLATIIASYAIACLAVSVCLDLVTARYEAAVENAENQQLDGVLNRQIDDRIWHNHAESVSALARAIAQEPQIRHLIEADDIAALRSALPQMSRREAVTSGAIALLGVAATRADGTMLTNDGGVPFASPDMDIPKLLSGRSGVDQLKVLTRVWTSEGQPVLTVIHPVGGLRPIGYVVVHASPLKTLSNLDQQMGMAITFWSADRTKELATLSNWKPAAEAQIYRFNINVRSPDGVVIMIADVGRDVTGRVGMMSKIRFWAFTSLVGILAAVAVGSIALILVTTRRMVSEGAYEEFKLAIEGMSHGLCMFDSEQRLIVCNQRYMQMYGLPPELA
ncbi:MAG TPA: PAS-domain containing protein, partial [Xanthobacteraceae bacterium]|nr:PAS-domain containing protein [Xanthobacteraceae bacterium]